MVTPKKILIQDLELADEEIRRLRKENKSLKESLDIATKCSSKEEDGIIRLSEENKKLKEENQTLELWLDNKEKLNEEYRKQLDKRQQGKYRYFGNDGEEDLYEDVGDDELIYEEGLYD